MARIYAAIESSSPGSGMLEGGSLAGYESASVLSIIFSRTCFSFFSTVRSSGSRPVAPDAGSGTCCAFAAASAQSSVDTFCGVGFCAVGSRLFFCSGCMGTPLARSACYVRWRGATGGCSPIAMRPPSAAGGPHLRCLLAFRFGFGMAALSRGVLDFSVDLAAYQESQTGHPKPEQQDD